jgi:hypothetical protein
MTGVRSRTGTTLILAGMVAYFNWILSIVSSIPRLAVTWTCDQLDWLSLSITIFIDNNSPFITTPQERERVFGCQELFSNSHLSVLRESSPWVRPLFTQTSLPPGYHENHLIWMASSLIVLELVLRLLTSDNKDQPPLPDHLKNLLIGVDSTKVIPLGFAQYVPWMLSRMPQLKPGTLALHLTKITIQVAVYVPFVLCNVYRTLFWLFAVNYSVIDYVWLLLSLCITLRLEMNSR